jgi:hypothetical protein
VDTCNSAPNADDDGDGYAVADGDCNDCDAAMNPGAFDVPGNQIDEDCSGTADDERMSCDDGLPVDGDAAAAARAIGLCRTTVASAKGKTRTWGLLQARYVFPNGTTAALPAPKSYGIPGKVCVTTGLPPNELSHGILNGLGPNVKPREGAALAALSSGIARAGRNSLFGTPTPQRVHLRQRCGAMRVAGRGQDVHLLS